MKVSDRGITWQSANGRNGRCVFEEHDYERKRIDRRERG